MEDEENLRKTGKGPLAKMFTKSLPKKKKIKKQVQRNVIL